MPGFLGWERAVIVKERCMEMSILRRQGKSLREIAVATGTSVNTVRKYLASGGPPKPSINRPPTRAVRPKQSANGTEEAKPPRQRMKSRRLIGAL